MASWLTGLESFAGGISTDISSVYKTVNTPTSVTLGGNTIPLNPATGQPVYPAVAASNMGTYLLVAGVGVLLVAFVFLLRR